MKKMLIALLGAGLFATAVFAENDTPIEMRRLPDAAQTFVKKYFAKVDVASVTMEQGMSPSYEVKLVDGTQIDFNSRGEWYDIERPRGVVPDEVVPPQILKFVTANYPSARISGIERDGRYHDIKLDNGMELTFNRKFRLVEMDD